MSVSIVTITQHGRFECLKILKDIIEEQTYKNILEWVIVEGSQTVENAEMNKQNIDILKTQTKININYVPYDGQTILGRLRNKSNNASDGDYIVCMDDDDYYPKERIEHAVTTLKSSKNLIAGNSGCMFYDYILDKQFISNVLTPNHSTNNCMAYKKEYLKDHRYDDTKTFAEESSFTKNFTEPMCQLVSKKTIIVSSHNLNTFNKRKLLIDGMLGRGAIREMTSTIPAKYYKLYRSMFRHDEVCPYDIVYMCGFHSIVWDPRDLKLGGSEQAVVNLSTEWNKKGYRVAVYGAIPLVSHLGVDYYPFEMFPFHHQFNILILWRLFGLYPIYKCKVNAKKIFWDLHDNMLNVNGIKDMYESYESKLNYLMFKSQYHKDEFEKMTNRKLDDKICRNIMNGVRIEKFQNTGNFQRNKYRFCYCSCYTRGLENILKYIWPVIYQNEPRAELHVYYGLNGNDPNWKNMMQTLLSTPGVMDHGRQDVEMINREKHLSSFHLYLSSSPSEIDCISVRESLVAGCIPLLTNFGVFKNRHGFHFDLNNDQDIHNVGFKILDLLKLDDETLENRRQMLMKSNTVISWENSADEWIKDF
jgi:glycosyltransferase involved in cell wall biosynthesis